VAQAGVLSRRTMRGEVSLMDCSKAYQLRDRMEIEEIRENLVEGGVVHEEEGRCEV